MSVCRLLLPTAVLLVLSGCHSAFVDATISNRTSRPIPLIEVDYPEASFGTQNLAPGADFHYRFKVLGHGATKVVYTDSSQVEKHVSGPPLNEGDEGPLLILFTPGGVEWQGHPSKR